MIVYILGISGMLGSMVFKVLSENQRLTIKGTISSLDKKKLFKNNSEKIEIFKVSVDKISEIIKTHDEQIWIINCIGKTKPVIDEKNAISVKQAIQINSLFPFELNDFAEKINARVINVSTDCVFSGKRGNYIETDLSDALDVYGKTKNLGEVNSSHITNFRCSLIGPEFENKRNLLEWFLTQKKRAKLSGFTNHNWDGVTTLHFAKIIEGVILNNLKLPNIIHLVPSDNITKHELLLYFAKYYNRQDLLIKPIATKTNLDLRLKTIYPDINENLWNLAGYKSIPRISEMVKELSEFNS